MAVWAGGQKRLYSAQESGQTKPMDIPPSWLSLPTAEFRGVILIIGAPDTGKSTLASYLYARLCAEGCRTAYLDGDPGQSILGPPATLTLIIGQPDRATFPPVGQTLRWFVGGVSPRGHMLPLVVGAARLCAAAKEAGAQAILYDTSGLVHPAQGGVSLKLAKIDLLCPKTVIAIQHDEELGPLLSVLRGSRRARLIELRPSPAIQPREVAARQAHRAEQFARYFAGARLLPVDLAAVATFPSQDLTFNQLVALENRQGFTVGLGIVRRADALAHQATLLTPLHSTDGVDLLRQGDLTVDPRTYRDGPLPRL